MEERKISNAEFQAADIFNLPYKNDTFDVAFTNAVLWTLEKPLQALEELKHVVRPGGMIACREPSSEGVLYYFESKIFEKTLTLQFRSQDALGCDRNIGKKLFFYFSEVKLYNIQLSVSSDVYSSPEKRSLLGQYSISAWNEAPWAKHVREELWATEEEIKGFQEELLRWEKYYWSLCFCKVV